MRQFISIDIGAGCKDRTQINCCGVSLMDPEGAERRNSAHCDDSSRKIVGLCPGLPSRSLACKDDSY